MAGGEPRFGTVATYMRCLESYCASLSSAKRARTCLQYRTLISAKSNPYLGNPAKFGLELDTQSGCARVAKNKRGTLDAGQPSRNDHDGRTELPRPHQDRR